jgi:LacI family transcriptional regulator
MQVGAQAATEHLIGHGYTSIGFVNLPTITPIIEDMQAGFKQALQKHGLTANQDHIYTLPETEPGQQGYALADQLIAAKQKLPRALLVTDEIAARGMMARFKEAGLAIPEDLAIISSGDSSQRAFDADGLTRIEQPVREKGMRAAEKMIHLINNPQDLDKPESVILKPTLESGSSCGC